MMKKQISCPEAAQHPHFYVIYSHQDSVGPSLREITIFLNEVRPLSCENAIKQSISAYVDKKTKGTIKLIISNLNGLKTKVTSSFHTIANLPWFVFHPLFLLTCFFFVLFQASRS